MRFIKSIFSKIQQFHSRNRSQRRNRGLKIEHLEDRSLLSAVPASWSLASISGTYDNSSEPVISLDLTADTSESVVIGIDYTVQDGSLLKPGEISIFSYDSKTETEKDITETASFLKFDGQFENESILYVKLEAGEYHIKMTPQSESTGAFTASVFLLGDVSGSGSVGDTEYSMLTGRISAVKLHDTGAYSRATIKLYQSLYGVSLTQSADNIYSSLYDLNLDSQLTAADAAIAKINLGTTVTAALSITEEPIAPEITPEQYTIPGSLDSDDFNPVTLDIPNNVTVTCEETKVESFTVEDSSNLTPELTLTTSAGETYTGREELLEYWDLTDDEYDALLAKIGSGTSIIDSIFSFQNGSEFFSVLDKDDSLAMTFTYTVNSFVYNTKSYKTATPGTLTLTIHGTGYEHADPVGTTSHTASFSVATSEIIYDGKSSSLNLLDTVTDPHGYPMTAELLSVTTADPAYSVTDGAVTITADGNVTVNSEILAEDFDGLKYGETTTAVVTYNITDTHAGTLTGTITITITGRNHAPVETVEHVASFNASTGALIFDGTSTLFNVLNTMYDYDGDAMTASKTGITQPEQYQVTETAITVSENGQLDIDTAVLQSDFADLPAGETSLFTINYAAADIHGAVGTSSITVTVTADTEGPEGVLPHTANVDLRSDTVIYDSVKSSLNLLDGVTGEIPLTAAITKIDAGAYTLPSTAVTVTADGAVNILISDFQEAFSKLAADETAKVIATFMVTDASEVSVASTLTITVVGKNNAPYEEKALNGTFDTSTGTILFSSGETVPDALYGVKDPEGQKMTATWLKLTPPAGYTVSEGAIQPDETSGTLRILVNTEILSADFEKLPAGETADITISILVTDQDGATLTRTVTLTVIGSAEPAVEEQVKLSLVAVTTPTDEQDGLKTLNTGTANFGTFYYLDADAVPETDYETIRTSNEYYLELWVQDNIFQVTGEQKFAQSIQVQLNYDSSSNVSVTIDDTLDASVGIFAGKTLIDKYLTYEITEENPWENIKAVQLGWLFTDELDWSLIEPVTNGENAYLLARFKVTLSEPVQEGFNTAISGVTQEESPFVLGWHYTRTGDFQDVDSSKFVTIDVQF